LSHLELSRILADFPSLCTLDLKYGARKLGMDYDKALFGMQVHDAHSLAHLFAKTRTLTKVILSENLLSDETVGLLVEGLIRNHTVTSLDLSHNKIGDVGAKKLCSLLESHGVLTDLHLGDNFVRVEGARAIATALSTNSVLLSLSLRLNPLGDDGGARLLRDGIMRNNSLTHLDLSAAGLDVMSAESLVHCVTANSVLTTLDLSSNAVAGPDGGRELLRALKTRATITALDLRNNVLVDEVSRELKTLLSGRAHERKEAALKAFQAGEWDEAL